MQGVHSTTQNYPDKFWPGRQTSNINPKIIGGENTRAVPGNETSGNSFQKLAAIYFSMAFDTH